MKLRSAQSILLALCSRSLSAKAVCTEDDIIGVSYGAKFTQGTSVYALGGSTSYSTGLEQVVGDYAEVTLPFTFRFFKNKFTKIYISRYGFVSFDPLDATSALQDPDGNSDSSKTNAISAFWTELSTAGETQYKVIDDKTFLVSWFEVVQSGVFGAGKSNFELVLKDTGDFELHQSNMRYKFPDNGGTETAAMIGWRGAADTAAEGLCVCGPACESSCEVLQKDASQTAPWKHTATATMTLFYGKDCSKSDNDSSKTSGGLRENLAVTIGVIAGCGGGMILIIALIIALYCRRRRRQRAAAMERVEARLQKRKEQFELHTARARRKQQELENGTWNDAENEHGTEHGVEKDQLHLDDDCATHSADDVPTPLPTTSPDDVTVQESHVNTV